MKLMVSTYAKNVRPRRFKAPTVSPGRTLTGPPQKKFLKTFEKILDKYTTICYNNITVKVPLSSKVIVARIKARVVKGSPPLLHIKKRGNKNERYRNNDHTRIKTTY